MRTTTTSERRFVFLTGMGTGRLEQLINSELIYVVRISFITTEELNLVMSTLGERLSREEVEEMIREADLDGDGKVGFSEFATMMNHRGPGARKGF